VTAYRNIWSLCGAIDYKPISQLLITAQVKGSLYDESGYEGLDISGSLPNIEAMLKLRYSHKKFTLGMTAELYGRTRWLSVDNEKLFDESATSDVRYASFIAPTSLNLSLYGDWRVSKTCTVFAEGNNLLGDVKGLTTYRWAFYREMGASFTVGVKVQF
jgi:glutaredoxin-related protein